MNDPCCTKKQKEIHGDKEIERCVNPKSQVHLAVVNDSFCSMCPVRAACSTPKKAMDHHPMPIAPNYPFCDHRIWKDNTPICSVTNLPVNPEICGRCDEETREKMATLPDMLIGYTSAIRRWIAAGRPTRSEEDQKAILEDHCLKCEMYDKQKNSCKNCGCSLAQTGNPLTSKLAMGTEKCPLGRWE